jgi:hypothetical protein
MGPEMSMLICRLLYMWQNVLSCVVLPSKTLSGVSPSCAASLSFRQQITSTIVQQTIVEMKNTPVVTPRIITYCSRGTGAITVALEVGGCRAGVALGWNRVGTGRGVDVVGVGVGVSVIWTSVTDVNPAILLHTKQTANHSGYLYITDCKSIPQSRVLKNSSLTTLAITANAEKKH